jgi:hypothetical protein
MIIDSNVLHAARGFPSMSNALWAEFKKSRAISFYLRPKLKIITKHARKNTKKESLPEAF